MKMVRAPCCEKMGLKKGPWTPEEDQILVSYIQKNGHGNWRALPKQAGLLRCGKSCRLRWTNYLRPDIKRGNFSKEEEDTIIQLHELLGNRWSAIAARLPGRTDNEIKNVWHTHLKKKLKNYNLNLHQTSQDSKSHLLLQSNKKSDSSKTTTDRDHDRDDQTNIIKNGGPVSPEHSSSELSTDTHRDAEPSSSSSEEEKYFPEIDESFWSEEILSEENENTMMMMSDDIQEVGYQFLLSPGSSSGGEDVMNAAAYNNATTSRLDGDDGGIDFWYDLFIRAGDLPELPEF